jgi:archaellum biogenesis ATPase FlaH
MADFKDAPFSPDPSLALPHPLEELLQFKVTAEMASAIDGATFLIDGVIPSGATTVLVGKPSAGKSLLARSFAGELHATGSRVLYINMDCTPADVKHQYQQTGSHGYELLAPHLAGSKGIEKAHKIVRGCADSDLDLSNLVLVIDTLKKWVDLMTKNGVKELFGVFRSLTAKGATVFVLAHANKYRDKNDNLIYEGVGDVESECDNLLYLESSTKGDIQTIQTVPSDKVRGLFYPRTWEYHRVKRELQPVTNVDVRSMERACEIEEQDQTLIEVIKSELVKGERNQGGLEALLSEHGTARVKAVQLLQRYCSDSAGHAQHWRRRKSDLNNAWIYSLIERGSE